MNTNNNKKSQKTQKNIENIFLNLLKEKDISDISVSLICSIANINRSTFYLHYNNVYDLLEQIEYKMIIKLTKQLNSNNNPLDSDSKRYLLPYLNYIYINKDFFTVFYKYSISNKYESELECILFTSLKKYLNSSIIKDTTTLNYCLEYYEAGLFSIIKRWILHDCKETPKEIAQIIKTCTSNHLLTNKTN